MYHNIKHEFYLDYESYPIVLGKTYGYKILETRIITGNKGPYVADDEVLFQHLVERDV